MAVVSVLNLRRTSQLRCSSTGFSCNARRVPVWRRYCLPLARCGRPVAATPVDDCVTALEAASDAAARCCAMQLSCASPLSDAHAAAARFRFWTHCRRSAPTSPAHAARTSPLTSLPASLTALAVPDVVLGVSAPLFCVPHAKLPPANTAEAAVTNNRDFHVFMVTSNRTLALQRTHTEWPAPSVPSRSGSTRRSNGARTPRNRQKRLDGVAKYSGLPEHRASRTRVLLNWLRRHAHARD